MEKNFKRWHSKKEQIDCIEKRPFFHEREIWFCHLGANVGFEQDGTGENFLRPVVIVRKFNNEIFWAIPLTKTQKRNKYYFTFTFEADILSTAVISQIRLIDARRLSHRIGDISKEDLKSLNQKLKELIP